MSEPVRAHAPNCVGCGPENTFGIGLELSGDADRLSGELTLHPHHEGSPGIAHGGTIATVLDDACGRFMYLTGEPAVTSRIEVDFLRPVRIGTRLTVEVEIEARDEQGIDVTGELRDADGRPLARCRARMVFVNPDHFVRHGQPAGAQSV